MAIRKPDEIMTSVRERLGEDTSDEALALIEDINDTLDSLSNGGSGVDWEKKYRDNDAAWRQKYRDRFFGKGGDDDDNPDDKDTDKNKNKKPRTYADLFKK